MQSVICFQSKAVSGINWKCSTKLFSGTVILICFVPNVSPLKHFLTGGNSKKANKKLVMKFLKLTVQQKNITIGTSQAHMDLQGPFCSWVGEYFYTTKHFLSKGISKGFVFFRCSKKPLSFLSTPQNKAKDQSETLPRLMLSSVPLFLPRCHSSGLIQCIGRYVVTTVKSHCTITILKMWRKWI